MTQPAVSVTVVSRGRASDLPLCLIGISQLDYPSFEVVLVADTDGIGAAKALSFFENIKVVEFNDANISAARNLGIAEAAGEIVAFIDDDAVPEPTWLHYLIAGFGDADVAAAGGFVIGRNGISFQWKGRSVDCFGVASALEVDLEKISVLTPQNGRAIKTEGTNMALRRDVIAQLGGFDPAFRFYLDETDVNFRLMNAGHRTALAPLAQVHHGYKASATRRSDRVPTDLFEIGASTAVYLRKHAPEEGHEAFLTAARSEQRQRALRHMVDGRIEARDIRRLMATFDRGVEDGKARSLDPLGSLPLARSGLAPMPQQVFGEHVVLTGRPWHRNALLAQTERAVKSGKRVSLFIFSSTARAHRVRFTPAGVWLQTGGLFGRSDRIGRRFKWSSRRKRLSFELRRLAKQRNFKTEGL
jgi:GT2 family glycosyltransferase